MHNINGYAMHDLLYREMQRNASAALKEMRGEFTPDTGCGEDIKKVVDLFSKAALGSVSAWNELARVVGVEGHRPTNMEEMAHAAGQVIQVYIFG